MPPGHAEAHRLNLKGIDAYNSGAYETAEQYFQEALDKLPGDPTIQENLERAKDRIAARKKKTEEEFNRDKEEALGQLKGISDAGDFDSGSGLKGVSSTESGLKEAPDSGGCGGLKDVITDPMVVDARCVPTGLPPEAEAEIPDTPSGNRVRKAFEAVMDHDWNVALAWFQDALNHDPGNAGIERLIDLAQFTIGREKEIRAQDKAVMATLVKREDERLNTKLAKAMDDFNLYYLPTHPAAQKPVELSAIPPASGSSTPDPKRAQESAKWKAFFDAIFAPSPKSAAPGSVSASKD
jgi:tetratricopeptide (TPR) repeat protein